MLMIYAVVVFAMFLSFKWSERESVPAKVMGMQDIYSYVYNSDPSGRLLRGSLKRVFTDQIAPEIVPKIQKPGIEPAWRVTLAVSYPDGSVTRIVDVLANRIDHFRSKEYVRIYKIRSPDDTVIAHIPSESHEMLANNSLFIFAAMMIFTMIVSLISESTDLFRTRNKARL